MNRRYLTLIITCSFFFPLTVGAAAIVDVTCGNVIPDQRIYNDDQAKDFASRCEAAGGVSQPGKSGSDATGPYTTALCPSNKCATGSQTSNTQTDLPAYKPLEPLTRESGYTGSLGSYLNTAFRVLITLGALVGVLVFVIGGISYMTSEQLASTMKAKDRMWAAVWGLLLLAGSVLILQTINPQLLNFNIRCIGNSSDPACAVSSSNPGGSTNTNPGGTRTPVSGTQTNSFNQTGSLY